MMNKFVLGIDLGAKGGLVLLNSEGEILEKTAMPEHPVDGMIDHYEVEGFFGRCMTHVKDKKALVVATEKLHSVFGSSAKSNYRFGENNGYVDGLIHIWFGRGTKRITPRSWQKYIFEKEGIDEIKDKKGKRATKIMASQAVSKIYPKEDFRKNSRCKIMHDGIVDAVLIAVYALENLCD